MGLFAGSLTSGGVHQGQCRGGGSLDALDRPAGAVARTRSRDGRVGVMKRTARPLEPSRSAPDLAAPDLAARPPCELTSPGVCPTRPLVVSSVPDLPRSGADLPQSGADLPRSGAAPWRRRMEAPTLEEIEEALFETEVPVDWNHYTRYVRYVRYVRDIRNVRYVRRRCPSSGTDSAPSRPSRCS